MFTCHLLVARGSAYYACMLEIELNPQKCGVWSHAKQEHLTLLCNLHKRLVISWRRAVKKLQLNMSSLIWILKPVWTSDLHDGEPSGEARNCSGRDRSWINHITKGRVTQQLFHSDRMNMILYSTYFQSRFL